MLQSPTGRASRVLVGATRRAAAFALRAQRGRPCYRVGMWPPTTPSVHLPPWALRLLLWSVVLVGAGVAPVPARATPPEPPPGVGRPAPGWFLLPGLSLGGAATLVASAPARWTFTLGGEVSAAYLWGTTWAGVYADGQWSTPGDRGRLGVGAEVGWAMVGVEAGWVAQLAPPSAGQPAHHGLRLGALATTGAVSWYLRWVHLPAQAGGGASHLAHLAVQNTVELGLLLKWPVGLSDQR